MNGHLTQAFKILNEGLFDKTLNENIEFEPNLSRKCIFGFHSTTLIEIGSEFITADKIDVFDDLLHVMIHVFNDQHGFVDHTANQYHNKRFSEKSLSIGLILVHHKTRGWATTLSDPTKVPPASTFRMPSMEKLENIRSCYREILWSDQEFQMYQDSLRKVLESKPQKEYQLKYICHCEPPVIIRSGRRPDGQKPIDITCNFCGENFSAENQTV